MDMALSPDYQLLTVVQNNVLKGFISNMLPLRLTQALISQEDSMSIFVLQPMTVGAELLFSFLLALSLHLSS